MSNEDVASQIVQYRQRVNNIFEGLKMCGQKMKTAG